MEIEEKIKEVLKKKVDPILSQHFGGALLSKYEDGTCYIKMSGHCAGCPSAQATLEGVIKEQLIQDIPELKDVKLDTSVSDELIDKAKEMLNKKNY